MKSYSPSKGWYIIVALGFIIPLIITFTWLSPESEESTRISLRATAICSFILFVPAFLSAAAPKLTSSPIGYKWRRVGIYFFWGMIASHTVHLSNIIYLIEVYYNGDPTQVGQYFPKVGYVLLYVLFFFSIKSVRKGVGDKLVAEYANFVVYFIMLIFSYAFLDITQFIFNPVQFALWSLAFLLIFIRGLSKVGVDNIKVREDDEAILPW